MTRDDFSAKQHWENIYKTKETNDVSWYQDSPTLSLRLIEKTGVAKNGGIIDVGGGASILVDNLLDGSYTELAVLDISGTALEATKARLGARVGDVDFVVADVTEFAPSMRYGVWHDRAVFHFLTDGGDREKYVASLKRSLAPGGHVVMATFAVDGPQKCSGLDVRRYDAPSMSAELGGDFELLEEHRETHVTPGGGEQRFAYFLYRMKA